MGWTDSLKKFGAQVFDPATQTRQAWSLGGGSQDKLKSFAGGIKDWMVGGNATAGFDSKPAQYDSATGMLQQIAGGAQGRQAPQAIAAQMGGATQMSTAQSDAARAQQQQLAGHLQGIMGGQQAGAGELAVNRQTGQALAAQQALARMGRGGDAALMARNAARNSADIGLGGAGQAAQAQMQDQSNAMGQLGGLLGGMRGQDIDVAGQNAQMQHQQAMQQGQFNQQANIENMRAKLAQSGMNDQQQMAALGQMLGWDQARIQAELAKRQLGAQDKGALGGIISGLGGMMAASDKRLKTEIRDAGKDADEMMAALRPTSYRYKDEAKYGDGPRLGILAQHLAKSKAGGAIVGKIDEKHLGFDIGKAASASLAAVGRLHERLAKIENQIK